MKVMPCLVFSSRVLKLTAESKQQFMSQWRTTSVKVETKWTSSEYNVMASLIWDRLGVLVVDLMPRGRGTPLVHNRTVQCHCYPSFDEKCWTKYAVYWQREFCYFMAKQRCICCPDLSFNGLFWPGSCALPTVELWHCSERFYLF